MPTTTGKATELITFSRGTLATVTDADGKIKWAPHNLLLASESFDNTSGWSVQRGIVTANNAAAPNGTTTAEKFTEDNTANTRSVLSLSAIAVPQATAGIFLKDGATNGRRYVSLILADGATGANGFLATFDLVNGTWTRQLVGTGSLPDVTMTSLGGGWYYCAISGVTTSTSAMSYLVSPATSATPTVGGTFGREYYTGDGVKNFLFWGAHLYRSDLGGMQANASAYPYYNSTTARNLFGYSESFSNAAWVAATGSFTRSSNDAAAPNGSLTADTITATAGNSTLWQTYVPVAGTIYYGSIWIKRKTGTGDVQFTMDGANFTTVSLGADWVRVSAPYTALAGTKAVGVRLVTSGDAVYLWGAQLSDSASLDAYSPNFGPAPSAAAYHGPRLDFDPVTRSAKGLLVEEARTNLLLRSNEFNISWVAAGTTVTANTTAVTAPDGTTTADKLVETATTGSHSITQQITSVIGRVYTASVYAKAAERTIIAVRIDNLANSFTWFNLATGVIGTNQSGVTATITDAGGGWYRCSVTGTATATNHGLEVYIADADNSSSYAGDITKGVYLYGAQLEDNAPFATSYIQNVNSPSGVTRNADVASVGVSQFPYSSTGTVVVSYNYIGGKSVPYPIGLDNGSGVTVFSGIRHEVSQFNTDQGSVSISPSLNATGLNKVAFAQAANDRAVSANGNAANTSTATYTPGTATTLSIGLIGNNAGTFGITGHIRQITYLPRRLTNAELQQRTA